MKNTVKNISCCLLVMAALSACKKSWVDIQPTGTSTVLEDNYYQTAEQIFKGLVAVYDPLGMETGNSYCSKQGLLDAASDDCAAGGAAPGPDQINWTAWDKFTVNVNQGPQADLWNRSYTGIFRANLLLQKMAENTISDLSDGDKARYIAECKFLRAYYYFDLLRLFKNVPLITDIIPTSDIYTIEQADPADVYAQIEQDLTDAIDEPNLPNTVPATTEGGRVTKGAAKALLGKVYLYEEKWTDAAAQLADVNGTPGSASTYGYQLQSNFSNIFLPTNKFNSESIFEIVHTNQAQQDWGAWGAFEGNVWVEMIGARAYSGPVYSSGWGFCPLTTSLVDALKNDPRYPYTCANIDSICTATGTSYEAGADNTGWFVEKYAPKLAYVTTLGGTKELNYNLDYIEIRLADTYLMEAEAIVQGGGDKTRAQALLDAVRSRAGLSSVTVSLDNIYNERRLELATEGHRFFDLVRWGKAAGTLSGFTAGKNEVLPIPIGDLNNTKLVQNPGYE
ncbi:RagB/SusD family nutrient uptake outer membrane protein [Parafilimonas sp.]|uniref:RagB/SusD family nutrient uptake outer membrane protein n=1 Tax=Parafilimonas sp. TaxID=1969739 RepID=UPI0039E70D58